MARYEINGQIYEVPDEVQGQQLVETLTMLSEQTAAPSAPAAPEVPEAPPAAPQGQPDVGMAGNLQRAISGERLTPEQLQQPVSREPGMVRDALANIGLEAMAAVNRGATGIADFAASLPNAVAQLSGRQEQIPSLTEAVSAGTAGGFMEPGLARDVVRGGGELVGPGALAGSVFRSAAQQLPRFGRAGESVLSGTIRQLGQSTPIQDVAFSALSGGGAALGGAGGEVLGGEAGRQVGEFTGGLLAPLAGGLLPMRAAAEAATPIPRPTTQVEDEAIAAAQATGLQPLPAQRTLDPQQLRAQRFLPELTPATERAAQALSQQNQQASSAVNDFVRAIAPDDAVVTAAGRFRNASQRALEAARSVRQQKASPIYQQAIEQAAPVDVQPVNRMLVNLVRRYPESGSVSRTARKVLNLMGQSETTVLGSTGEAVRVAAGQRPSLARMHNVKLEIDDMLSKVGEDALGNTAKRELVQIKQALLEQMESASPVYRDARLAFEAASPPVTQLEESIIGKIANIDDTQLKNVSRRIFDPAETNPTVVRQAKQVIDDVDPDAWNRLVRAEVERRIGSIRPEVGTSFENIPGKLNRAIFGTGKQRDALLSGLNPEQRRNAELLETALTRASLGRPGGSETAGRQQFIRELDTGVVSALRNFFREPVDRIIGLGESQSFDRRAKALADALFDPAWSGEAREALKDRSGKAFGFLLYRVNDALESLDRTQNQTDQQSQQPRVPLASAAQPVLQAQ